MSEKLCELRKKGGGGGKYTETSLWTNPSPTSSFANQTVTLSDSVSNYKYIKFVYRFSTSNAKESSAIYSVDDVVGFVNTDGNFLGGGLAYPALNIARAVIYKSPTSFEFGTSYRSGSSGTYNGNLIPTEILGLNELDHGTIEDYATISVATTGTSNVCTGYAVASNSNKFTASYTNGSASGTITVLEEGLYDYISTAANRGTGTATVKIGNQSYTTGKGEVYISANTVCTVSVGGTAGSLGLACITLVKKS